MEPSARSNYFALALALVLAVIHADILALELVLKLALLFALEDPTFAVEVLVLAIALVVIPTVATIFLNTSALAWARTHDLFKVEAATTALGTAGEENDSRDNEPETGVDKNEDNGGNEEWSGEKGDDGMKDDSEIANEGRQGEDGWGNVDGWDVDGHMD